MSTPLLEAGSAHGAEAEHNPIAEWSKLQKIAALMVVVGHDIAIQVLNGFEEREVEEITTEMAKIAFVPMAVQKALLKEFSPVTLEAVTAAHGGPEYARQVLEKALGTYKANEVMNRIAPSKVARTVDTAMLREIQPRQLMNALRREQPSMWALILSYLEPATCAQILSGLNPEQRTEIVERIAGMEPVNAEIIQKIMSYLKDRLNLRGQADTARSGGTRILAQILNNLDDTTSQQVLSSLDERNPDLSRSIKKLLFVFDDLGALDKSSLQKVLREVDTHDLAVALKTANEPVRNAIFGAMTKRAVESLAEEIQYLPPVRLKQIEEAQEKILEAVRNLEANGEIVVSRGGGSDGVV